MIDGRQMYFFSSPIWDKFRISIIMMNFNNISSLINVLCTFSLHQNVISLEFLSPWWISTIFHHCAIIRCSCSLDQNEIVWVFLWVWCISTIFYDWPMSYVLSLFTKVRWVGNFSQHDEFEQYLIIHKRRMYLFYSWKWDHFRIFLSMMNFSNISSLSNMRCPFCLYETEIILEFLWGWGTLAIFHHWPSSDVLLLFTKMRWVGNFSHHDEFQQYFIID